MEYKAKDLVIEQDSDVIISHDPVSGAVSLLPCAGFDIAKRSAKPLKQSGHDKSLWNAADAIDRLDQPHPVF